RSGRSSGPKVGSPWTPSSQGGLACLRQQVRAVAPQAVACVLFSGAELPNLGLACRPNRSLVLRLPSETFASFLAPSLPMGLTDALILTASLSQLTGRDRDAGHHQ